MSSINADDYFAQLAKMLDEKKQKEYAEAEEAEKKIKAEYEEMLAKLKSSEKKDDHLENQYGETSSNSDFSDYFKTITDAHEHITRQKREDARRAVAEKKKLQEEKELEHIQRQMSPLITVFKKHQSTFTYLPHLGEEVLEYSMPRSDINYLSLARQMEENLDLIRNWLDLNVIDKLDTNPSNYLVLKKHLLSISLLGYFDPEVKTRNLLNDVEIHRKKTEQDKKVNDEMLRQRLENINQETRGKLLVLEEKQKVLTQAQSLFQGWEKYNINGKKIPIEAECWAALLDQVNGLMWAVNISNSDLNPNRNKISLDLESNNSLLKEHIYNVNKIGWCGFHDWRLPTIEELRKIIFKTKDSKFDKIKYQRYFTEHFATEAFLSNSIDKTNIRKINIAFFNSGIVSQVNKTNEMCVRLVRSMK